MFREEAGQALAATQSWTDDPARNFISFFLQVLDPFFCHRVDILLRQLVDRFLVVIEYRMDYQFGRVGFNRACSFLRAKYVGQISAHFQSRHRRIKGSSGVLETAPNDSYEPMASLNRVIGKLWQKFDQLFKSYHIIGLQEILKGDELTGPQFQKAVQVVKRQFVQMMRFYQQYQCMIMKKSGQRDSILPAIPNSKSQQKPIKDILKELKQRKMVIQSRIKTQIEQSETDEKDENQFQLRERIVTQVPYYINRNTYYKRVTGRDSLDQIMLQSKIKQKQQQQQSARDSNLQSQLRKRHSILEPIPDEQTKYENSPKSRKQMLKEIQQLFVQVPVDPRERTEASIQQLKQFLVENNIFFAKIHNIIGTCLLKLNRLMWLEKHQTLYKKGEERHSFYIILCGRLKIYDGQKNLKKICSAGQSIGQELLFSSKIHKTMKESAKAVSRCFLVEIKIQNYKKMAQEMVRYGYRVIFNETESIIKRNYITKNWLRGEKERFEKKS